MSQSAVKYMEVRWRVKGTLQWSAPKQYPPAAEVAVDGLERDTDYEFEARNVSDCGASSEWVPSDYTVPTPPELPAVTSLVATPVSYAMHFTWSIDVAPSASILYSFERAASAAGPFTQLAVLRTNVYTAPETTGTTYWYRVCAMNVAGEKGTYSNVVSGGSLVGKVQTFYQATSPSGTGRTEGDLWFDTDDSNHPYRWSGSAWVSVQDGDISAAATSASSALSAANNAMTAAQAAQATADGAIRTYYQSSAPSGLNSTTDLGDLWFDTDTNQAHRWNGSSWVLIEDNTIAEALAAAQSAQTTADGKITAYYQTSAPASGMGAGDLWYDTNDNNKPYYYTGSAWKSIRDGTIGQVFRQSNPPTPTSNNDMWFDSDDNNCPYVASGSSWINVRDGTILQAANNANDARSIATAAGTAAAAAQSTADGKVSPGDSITVLGGRTLANIGDGGGRYAASEAGADRTRKHVTLGENVIVNPSGKDGTAEPHQVLGSGVLASYIHDSSLRASEAPGGSFLLTGTIGSAAWIYWNGSPTAPIDDPSAVFVDAHPGEIWFARILAGDWGAGNTGNSYFAIRWYQADGTYITQDRILTSAISDSDLLEYTVSAVAPAGTGRVSLIWYSYMDGTNNHVLMQQVELRKATVADVGSGLQVGDNRNLPPVTWASIGSAITSLPISYTISGTTVSFGVAACTFNGGGFPVSYPASSGSISQAKGSTVTYYLYYRDSTGLGGAKNLNITSHLSDLAQYRDVVSLGTATVTVAAGGGGSGGTGGGGGGILPPPNGYPIP